MLPDPSRTLGLTSNGTKPTGRRGKALLVILLVWALAATGTVGWIVFRPAGTSQDEVWASDAAALRMLDRDFGLVALDTSQYIATRDGNWTWNAANWASISWQTVSNATAAPGGFPSGKPLGFNTTAMCVALYGYNHIHLEAITNSSNYPYIVPSAAVQVGLYQNLSARLGLINDWSAGRSPLSVIGTNNVTAIHDLMLALWTANLGVGYGQGPIIFQECGL